MKPYYEDLHIKLYNKDCRSMTELPDESVQCVVTSPPYWGLRKYAGVPDLIWGGDKDCEHKFDQPTIAIQGNNSMIRGVDETDSGNFAIPKFKDTDMKQRREVVGSICSLCGAWKGSYGLEPTPEMYIDHTIEILREIRRVLRKDGVVFWNIGDSYWGGKGQSGQPMDAATQQERHGRGESINQAQHQLEMSKRPQDGKHYTLKPKDLCLIPFRVALATQGFAAVSAKEMLYCADLLKLARDSQDWEMVSRVEKTLRMWSLLAFLDGMWSRSVIIWSKSNPMPESVTDRPTNSHEYILMLTKSGTNQYWTHRDCGGARKKPRADYRWVNQLTQEEVATEPADWKQKIKCPECEATGIVKVYLGLDVWQETKCPTCNGEKETRLWKRINLWRGHDYYWDADAVREVYTEPMNRWGGETLKRDTSKTAAYKEMQNIGYSSAFRVGRPMRPNPSGRNIRSVWEFPTQPYPEAHFAVFPGRLPELCIKAATPEVGCCSKCGAPWERVLEKGFTDHGAGTASSYPEGTSANRLAKLRQAARKTGSEYTNEQKTISWQPTCKCNADKVPSKVLDSFASAGTTLWEAKILGREATGYELSVEYCELIAKRNSQQVMM